VDEEKEDAACKDDVQQHESDAPGHAPGHIRRVKRKAFQSDQDEHLARVLQQELGHAASKRARTTLEVQEAVAQTPTTKTYFSSRQSGFKHISWNSRTQKWRVQIAGVRVDRPVALLDDAKRMVAQYTPLQPACPRQGGHKRQGGYGGHGQALLVQDEASIPDKSVPVPQCSSTRKHRVIKMKRKAAKAHTPSSKHAKKSSCDPQRASDSESATDSGRGLREGEFEGSFQDASGKGRGSKIYRPNGGQRHTGFFNDEQQKFLRVVRVEFQARKVSYMAVNESSLTSDIV
jgi:hypothetical protein